MAALLHPMRGGSGMMRLMPGQRQAKQPFCQRSSDTPTDRQRYSALQNASWTVQQPTRDRRRENERKPNCCIAESGRSVRLQRIDRLAGEKRHCQ